MIRVKFQGRLSEVNLPLVYLFLSFLPQLTTLELDFKSIDDSVASHLRSYRFNCSSTIKSLAMTYISSEFAIEILKSFTNVEEINFKIASQANENESLVNGLASEKIFFKNLKSFYFQLSISFLNSNLKTFLLFATNPKLKFLHLEIIQDQKISDSSLELLKNIRFLSIEILHLKVHQSSTVLLSILFQRLPNLTELVCDCYSNIQIAKALHKHPKLRKITFSNLASEEEYSDIFRELTKYQLFSVIIHCNSYAKKELAALFQLRFSLYSSLTFIN